MLLYTYKALNSVAAPEYLCNMVESYPSKKVLRSASQTLLVVPRGKHCQYGMRTFAMAAATLIIVSHPLVEPALFVDLLS